MSSVLSWNNGCSIIAYVLYSFIWRALNEIADCFYLVGGRVYFTRGDKCFRVSGGNFYLGYRVKWGQGKRGLFRTIHLCVCLLSLGDKSWARVVMGWGQLKQLVRVEIGRLTMPLIIYRAWYFALSKPNDVPFLKIEPGFIISFLEWLLHGG